MNRYIRSQQDFAAGLLFIGIAIGVLWMGWSYPTGTAVRMSAGYFPRLLGGILLLLGLIVFVGSF
ncbi:MAG: tripartite tricarboxylate transporter TctB family protein, partial [Rhizobiales bacterium]|nr:tripartite tricarboxylate transporter TctB family protein [Hyphomicrobiales bacterium]